MLGIGRIVHYALTASDATAITYLRDVEADARRGNPVAEGQVYPAIVVRVFDPPTGYANLQVLLDGNDSYWATSRTEGEGPGRWAWPKRDA